MGYPSQDYMRNLRENPETALIAFVQELHFDHVYKPTPLWNAYNSHRGFLGQRNVFIYAIRQAGMELVAGGLVRTRETLLPST